MGGKTKEGKRRRQRGGREAWLYTLQAKLFPRTEKHIGEKRNGEAKRGNHSSVYSL
jgi:hypothetical protein